MLKTNKLAVSALFSALAFLSCQTSVNAALPGYYIGGQVGLGDTHWSSSNSNSANNGSTLSLNNNQFASRLFGGYQFDTNWAFEVGYTKFARTNYTVVQANNNRYTGSIQEYSVDALAKGIVPLDSGFSLFGDAGAAYIKTRLRGNFADPAERFSPAFGAGISYDACANVPVTLSWNHIQNLNNAIPNTDLFALGVAYNFG